MNTLLAVIITTQVVTALFIIALVLLQQGKGADMGAAFGSGASGSLFGASGSSNFLSKMTGVAATVFFSATLALAFLGSRPAPVGGGVMDQIPTNSSVVPGELAAPANPANSGAGQSGEIPK